ncbi:ferrochelatase [Clavulina sp. PMI_390]|nr:ferrochelatase [Clavulina sp. PMI_390]
MASSTTMRKAGLASLASARRSGSSPTAVVLMNMGGPSTLSEVHPFLSRLFHDRDLIPLPFQRIIAPIIAKRRTPQIEEQYAAIGGGSPIRKWTDHQGAQMALLLDELSPATAPHKAYTMFRYADPLTDETLSKMKADGVQRAIAFTQYPQYSCSTTGSSLNELYKRASATGMTADSSSHAVQWSVVDRWATHPGLVNAFAENVVKELAKYPESARNNVVLLFSAHSLPMEIVNRGDPYPMEVASTVTAVIQRLRELTGYESPYRLVWQSQVGPRPWLGMKTPDALKGLAKNGRKDVILVPIAFTSDHIETLYELDHEYGTEAKELGMNLQRAESLNGSPTFIRALADIAAEHLRDVSSGSRGKASTQMMLRCPGCTNETCGKQKVFFERGGQL